jgi:ABC-type branched-subunit amino acid transport system substrate-binding protein
MAFKNVGLNWTSVLYPANATDLSDVGTKIKTLNPDVVAIVTMPQIIGAAWSAGYRGQFFEVDPMPTAAITAMVPPEALGSFIGGAEPTEFDPPTNKAAQDYKAAYMAKYNKWGTPGIAQLNQYICLKEALQKAGSTDPAKVAAVIGGGFQFDCPMGTVKMVARPEMGNNRTVSSIIGVSLKKIVGGKAQFLTTIKMEDATAYWNQSIGVK